MQILCGTQCSLESRAITHKSAMLTMSNGGRVPTQQCLFGTNGQSKRAVHSQRFDCSPSCFSLTYQAYGLPTEMSLPQLATGIVKRNRLATMGINRLSTGGFAQGTGNTGKGQIVQVSFSAVSYGHHMVNVKRRFLAFLG